MAASGEVARAARRESGAMTLIAPHVPHGRIISAADVPAVAATLAAAFQDDPVFVWWIPDATRRRAILPAYFGAVARSYVATGVVQATDELACAAVWGLPGVEEDEELGPAVVAAAEEHTDRLFEIVGLMEEAHTSEPHRYLFFLGTRPEHRSRGLGSALLRPVLDACDAQGVPAYLEATSPRGAALYERHGFEVTGEIALPHGPRLQTMWREPRG
jgi:ribosomal protein S18 acetylase RimI-like enzyme